jgi:hypothetical protein
MLIMSHFYFSLRLVIHYRCQLLVVCCYDSFDVYHLSVGLNCTPFWCCCFSVALFLTRYFDATFVQTWWDIRCRAVCENLLPSQFCVLSGRMIVRAGWFARRPCLIYCHYTYSRRIPQLIFWRSSLVEPVDIWCTVPIYSIYLYLSNILANTRCIGHELNF